MLSLEGHSSLEEILRVTHNEDENQGGFVRRRRLMTHRKRRRHEVSL